MRMDGCGLDIYKKAVRHVDQRLQPNISNLKVKKSLILTSIVYVMRCRLIQKPVKLSLHDCPTLHQPAELFTSLFPLVFSN